MALPREPRQKMINMMYLVLTALLALNVSSEILNAFKTVNKSLENTSTTVNNSTTTIMSSLKQKATEPTTMEKAKIWLPKANLALTNTQSLYATIQSLKDEIITEAGGDPKDMSKKFKEDNLDIATRILIEKGKGKSLLQDLTKFKDYITNALTKDTAYKANPKTDAEKAYKKKADDLIASLPIDLAIPNTRNKAGKTWEGAYFHMVPTVAALTILSKFQSDVKTAENRYVAFCHEQVSTVEVRFDTYEAIVGQNSKYFMPGQEVEITAALGAFSKNKLPTVTINGANQTLNEKGMAVYKTQSGAIGPHTINVKVDFTDQDGKPQTRTIPVEYEVGQASASIALDKMNVLYVGVPNPVSIAASGGGDDRVKATISNGSLERVGNGKYVARVNQSNADAVITVTVDGKVVGASNFRVRNIPKPAGFVGTYESGANVPVNAFRAQAGVGAGVRDFPFDLKYTVQSFTISADTDDGYIDDAQVQGNQWNQQARTLLNNLKPGRTVMIDEIYALGEDGRRQKLPSLVFYIK